jgi:SpoVK/Ycf46/Vps4 family AAA+-type ATPase
MVSVRDDLLLKIAESGVLGRLKDLKIVLKVLSSEVENSSPKLAHKIESLVGKSSLRNMQTINPHPLETTKLPSMLNDLSNETIESAPIHSKKVLHEIESILSEHKHSKKLIASKLTPINTVIFEGPPGVGKTLTAKWLARKLSVPLYVLDLASVMNSHLGKTGNNIKEVFEFASNQQCVLLLDEFDAIAKKRGDDSEIGELKRLVTVLLQALDSFQSNSIVIAATNHSELLDPAVWRRFEKKVSFPLPNQEQIKEYILSLTNDSKIMNISTLFEGMNYSDVNYIFQRAKKNAIINDLSLVNSLIELVLVYKDIDNMELSKKKVLGALMVLSGISQRDAAKRLSLSRPSIKKELEKLEG